MLVLQLHVRLPQYLHQLEEQILQPSAVGKKLNDLIVQKVRPP